MNGILTNPQDRRFGVILCPDAWEENEDTILNADANLIRKVNPHTGITVQADFYAGELSKARTNQDYRREVMTKLFNVFQSERVVSWLQPRDIRPLQRDAVIDKYKAERAWIVFAGMDFSQGNDLHTIAYLAFNTNPEHQGPRFFADFDAWVSEETLRSISIRPMYEQWIEQGWLHVCEGKVFEPSLLTARVMELSSAGVNLAGFGYDPYQSRQVVNDLGSWIYTTTGADPKEFIIPVRQNFASYNPVVDEFTYMVQTEEPWIRFSSNPMWPWLFGNVALAVSTDGMENKKPVKASTADSCKVDPIQALLSALMVYDLFNGKVQEG